MSTKFTGYLTKRGRVFPTWKKRYFVLENGTLSYFGPEGEKLGSIKILHTTAVSDEIIFMMDYCFSVKNNDNNNDEVLFLSAETENDKKLWIAILKKYIKSLLNPEKSSSAKAVASENSGLQLDNPNAFAPPERLQRQPSTDVGIFDTSPIKASAEKNPLPFSSAETVKSQQHTEMFELLDNEMGGNASSDDTKRISKEIDLSPLNAEDIVLVKVTWNKTLAWKDQVMEAMFYRWLEICPSAKITVMNVCEILLCIHNTRCCIDWKFL
jgi:hypothetical protein